ncbi:related to protein C21orf6 (GL011) [Cephalotrichum gorgonifer]|uniref:Related to protein C21orf6 (GL011) n=1 Tax=Cephalotrichum gorgonifer TaxID=2041049 RepID=A0AAE8SYX8_9PEZI|nr:related to protein C21orf6 (GL011) [Cephalotrichum gorgonifer]
MAATKQWQLLPHSLIEHQIGQVDLLMAMYPAEGEVAIDMESERVLSALRASVAEMSTPTFRTPPVVTMLLTLTVPGPGDPGNDKVLEVDLNVPFSWEDGELPDDAPSIRVRVRQPSWLNRTSTAHLNSRVAEGDEDLFGTIQSIQEAAVEQLEQLETTQASQVESSNGASSSGGPLVRAWFYFPSISTRSKRDDLVAHAPPYGLTGFLYAGKPGLLCVEGPSRQIDDYMRFIKTESWGDIPAHHKKVSERRREGDIPARAFGDMREITDSVGGRRGTRANRGDMKAVEGWLVERGLGDAFAKVLM